MGEIVIIQLCDIERRHAGLYTTTRYSKEEAVEKMGELIREVESDEEAHDPQDRVEELFDDNGIHRVFAEEVISSLH